MMKIKAIFFCFALLLSLSLTAQTKDTLSTAAKIDSIYNLQKKAYKEAKINPLNGKNVGIELNIFRLLIIDKARTFSGSFSLFNVDRDAEISFPIYFQNPKEKNDLTEFTLDCHYRYFLNGKQKGFYLSGFARYAYLSGTLGDNSFYDNDQGALLVTGTEHKLGVGVGLGVRIFSRKGFYWGSSFSVGRFIAGKNDKFMGNFLSYDDDNEFIVDIELLKFGWAF